MTYANAESKEALWDLIKDIKFAMFTTRHEGGHLHSRPMTTQNSHLDDDGTLWFFMSQSGQPVAELRADSSVNVVYADPGSDVYVSVSGAAKVSNDEAKKHQLWSKLAEAWFPGGVNDPDLALVAVRINHANYWDVKESKIVQLYEMFKAAVTGKPPTLGQHGEVRMR